MCCFFAPDIGREESRKYAGDTPEIRRRYAGDMSGAGWPEIWPGGRRYGRRYAISGVIKNQEIFTGSRIEDCEPRIDGAVSHGRRLERSADLLI